MNRRAVWVAGLVLAGGAGKAAAQDLVNAGSVALTCDICECQGTSDDGTITVFDVPSSGERVRGETQRHAAGIQERFSKAHMHTPYTTHHGILF